MIDQLNLKLLSENELNSISLSSKNTEVIEFYLTILCNSFLKDFLILESLQEKQNHLSKMLSKTFYSAFNSDYHSFISSLNIDFQENTLTETSFEVKIENDFFQRRLFLLGCVRKIKEKELFYNITSSEIVLSISNNISISINTLLLKKALFNDMRLDIFLKFHILSRLITSINLLVDDNQITSINFPFLNTINIGSQATIDYLTLSEKKRLSQTDYHSLVSTFVRGKDLSESIDNLFLLVKIFQNSGDKESLDLIEKLTIQLLGHWEGDVIEESITLLNMICDNHNFQENYPLDPVLRRQNESLIVKYTLPVLNITSINQLKQSIESTFCIVSKPKEVESLSKSEYIVFFCPPSKIELKKINKTSIELVFTFTIEEKASLSGYYDYNIITFNSENMIFSNCQKLLKIDDDQDSFNYIKGSFKKFFEVSQSKNENYEVNKGRFIVLNKRVDDLSIHEVFPDHERFSNDINNNQSNANQRNTKSGHANFKLLSAKILEYKERYINCLYIMGALERDNQILLAKSSDPQFSLITNIGNSDASPMAITSRNKVSTLLGGDTAFNQLIRSAKENDILIIVDALARVSSSRHNRKYKHLLLNSLDSKGKLNIVYGSDGHTIHYEDTAMLNYRMKECWDLFIEDVVSLADKHSIDGIHLDSCQTWPHINGIDQKELFRIDDDGFSAYTDEEILLGKIVIPNEESGFWISERSDFYSNPFYIKITKEIWRAKPNFIIIGESWSNKDKYKLRHVSMLRSGIIPRLYSLPRAISMVLGRRIHRNGYIEMCKPEDISIIKNFLFDNYAYCPKGSRIIQSSSGQAWPYPALLYSRGNWAAVDLLFTIMDVPMTFMNEIYGEAYRFQITSIYERSELMNKEIIAKRKSMTSLEPLSQESKKPELKQIKMSFTNLNDPNIKIPKISSKHSMLLLSNKELEKEQDESGSIQSQVSLSGIPNKNMDKLKEKQNELSREIGPEFGFDLSKIELHYQHRRKLRDSHNCLKYGDLIYLECKKSNEDIEHEKVIAFARKFKNEVGIIIINFSFEISNFKIDFNELLKEKEYNNKSVCYIKNWQTENDLGNYQLLCEILAENKTKSLLPFKSQLYSFEIMNNSEKLFKETLNASLSTMISHIKKSQRNALDNFYISIKFFNILESKTNQIIKFSEWMCYLHTTLEKFSISELSLYFSNLDFLIKNNCLANRFYKYLYMLMSCFNNKQNLNPYSLTIREKTNDIILKNKLGPIVFITPELGRWSTVGGLGVMVDELSQGLASEGREVIMITPYYDKNRKGESNYLKTDPIKFEHIGNITIHLDTYYSFGVHYGIVNGVKIYFLHNFNIFPIAYPDSSAEFTIRQISCFCKASLELLCFIKLVPDIILTNDWFTGLSAAYSKYGHFGNYFKSSIFFHICHNLEPAYEGRLYPDIGTLEHIYKLPSHLLIDPYWEKKVINPSRCAILCSDQWGTVSKSYLRDLKKSSPLMSLLNEHKEPFGYPNGIFRENRLKTLAEKVGLSHLEAKKKIQLKYFGLTEFDDSIPLFSFIGRITTQKGVLLILNTAEMVITKYKEKINILIGGMGNMKDPYVIQCTEKIIYLKHKYPHCFWADPNEFFVDGPLINIGSDFGLMPSLFEPGGIVQHEFFIASTPVLAFRTGGLYDTVNEFDYENLDKGNGICFESHSTMDLLYAFDRAIVLYSMKNLYLKARENAFKSAIDVVEVAREWDKEFHRLKKKVYFNKQQEICEEIDETIKQTVLNSIEGFDYKNYDFEDQSLLKKSSFTSFNNDEDSVVVTFTLPDYQAKYTHVSISGSFNGWTSAVPLSLNPILQQWNTILKLPKGDYQYKYKADNDWMINYEEKVYCDENGIMNNVVNV